MMRELFFGILFTTGTRPVGPLHRIIGRVGGIEKVTANMARHSFPASMYLVVAAVITGSAAWAAELLSDAFNTESTPALVGRVYESRLDVTGWFKPHGWPGNGYVASNWEISGGTLNNATADPAAHYAAGECPAAKWWTNPSPGIPVLCHLASLDTRR